MQKLIELSKKKSRIVAGLMSGTSVDGIDVAIVEITGNGINSELNLLAYDEVKYPDGFKDIVLKNSDKKSASVEDICRLDFLIPRFYDDAIRKVCNLHDIDHSKIDLIGSHGQTIHHLPVKEKMFGYEVTGTMQIGSGSVLAQLSGIPVVSKFRNADMAVGGQGAPLVPYFDYIMYTDKSENRALLNIGGISNFSILAANGKPEDITAFDTGPGNMLIDKLMQILYNKSYDKNGEIASSGKLNDVLFEKMKSNDEYISKTPPKSTGREYYGNDFVNNIILGESGIPDEDIIHTVAAYTAFTVFSNYEKFVADKTKIDKLFVSGGGAKNKFIMRKLQEYFGKTVKVTDTAELGIDPDAKEAVCFAVLANEFIAGNPANVPSVTGAERNVLSGELALP